MVARLAQSFADSGNRTLAVLPRPTMTDCRPLFQWNASRPLSVQITPMAQSHLLLAPDCQAGDRDVVDAAAGQFDVVLFGLDDWLDGIVRLETATAQHLLILVDANQTAPAYALLKALHENKEACDWPVLLAGAGAEAVSQAAARFLNLAFSRADQVEEVWQIRHAALQTSSNTLTVCPDFPHYVARILRWRAPEATITNHAR